jgi:CRP-like cAMP-binding protein
MRTFKPIDAAQLEFIQSFKIGEMSVRAREPIIREDDTSDHLYTVLDGWAFRYKTLADGRRQILNFLLPGDLIGLQAKLFESATHGVEALTGVRVCVFARERIWDVFRAHPALAYDMTWLGAREEHFVDDSLLSAGRRSAAEAVAALMLHLFRRGRALGYGSTKTMPVPITQAHIADAVGLSTVHANRTLRSMRARRLFVLEAGVMRDVDVEGLRQLANASELDLHPRPLI